MPVRVRLAVSRVARAAACGLMLLAGLPATAAAQAREKLPIFAIDVQGAVSNLPNDDIIAELRGVPASSLPSWGPGFNLAGHVYPLRSKNISLGIGANYQWLRGSKTPGIPDGASSSYDPGPSVTTKFVSFAPQVSLNFGHRRGWSYLSGGLGPSTLTISRNDLPDEPGESQSTLSWGGGGRWFVKPHMAFSLDVRIYNIPVQEVSELSSGHPSGSLVALNIGLSFQ